MAKKTRNKKRTKKTEEVETTGGLGWPEIGEIGQVIIGIIGLVITLFLTLGRLGAAGPAGEVVSTFFTHLLGYGYFLLPLVGLIVSVAFIQRGDVSLQRTRALSGFLFVVGGIGLIEIAAEGRGGWLGRVVAGPLVALFETYVSIAILGALLLIAAIISLNVHPLDLFARKEEEDEDDEYSAENLMAAERARAGSVEPALKKASGEIETDDAEAANSKPSELSLKTFSSKKTSEDEFAIQPSRPGTTFTAPPLSLLEPDKGKAGVGDIKANANQIRRTLRNFGIPVEMDEVTVGPTVTRYALKPAEGVKLARIESLSKEVQASLAARSLRIEAPIPGTSLVGIEVPNTTKATVGVASLLSDPQFTKSERPLLSALGRAINGEAHFADIAKMPHMLVAGSTGAGKSVAVHMLITSLLYRNSPDTLKFIMVDPKRVELTLYDGIPHLLTPVIKTPKKAILALKWAAKEMERRYGVLEEYRVQNIDTYHKQVLVPALKKAEKAGAEDTSDLPEAMPYIVVVVDEMADLMQTYPKELEAAIVRLAQMSRAVGIHLILSTQRPSANVVTGLIKANIPTRIALRVANSTDSRIILDQNGAEKLLGQGDMLYLGGEMAKPVRLQSGFVSEGELKKIVDWIKEHYAEELEDSISLEEREEGTDGGSAIFAAIEEAEADEEKDDKYGEAKLVVIESGKASTSFLQRRLGLGYGRAARIIDMLEEDGIIGPQNGSKPRDVLVRAGEQTPDEMISGEAPDNLEL